MTYQYIIDKIVYAFSDVNCLGGTTMADCIIADGYGDQAAISEAKGKDESRNWQAIPDEWIERYDSVFCFANDIGARFLLPAYMIWTIKNARKSDACTAEFLLYFLGRVDKSKSFADILTNDQKGAVRDFLSYMKNQMTVHCDANAAEIALNKWKCV